MDDINSTEMRTIYKLFGIRLHRGASSVEELVDIVDNRQLPTTDQEEKRKAVEKFVASRWTHLKPIAEVYGCYGNCTNPKNSCSDVRAAACYLEIKESK